MLLESTALNVIIWKCGVKYLNRLFDEYYEDYWHDFKKNT